MMKHRGDRGVTLIELMISLLIIAVIMMAWWRIAFATSPYREAQRRAAIEIAAGLLDVMPTDSAPGYLQIAKSVSEKYEFKSGMSSDRYRFPSKWMSGASPVCYKLRVMADSEFGDQDGCWSKINQSYWGKIEIFDGEDSVSFPKPFVVFTQLLR